MSGVREVGMEGLGLRSGAASGEPEASREVRWSAHRKEQVVLRLLRGESLDLLARETGQPAGRIADWREECDRQEPTCASDGCESSVRMGASLPDAGCTKHR